MKGEIKVLVEIIAVVAALVVMLVVMWPVLKDAMFGAGEKGQCDFSIALASLAKTASAGIIELPIECKMKRITITNEDLEDYQTLAQTTIKNDPSQNLPLNLQGYQTWALNKILADQLVACYDKGKNLLGPDKDWVKYFKGRTKPICLLCARVIADQSIPLQSRKLSLNTWLKLNKIGSRTYADTILQQSEFYYTDWITDEKITATLDTPAAVTFFVPGAADGTVKGGALIYEYASLGQRCSIIIGD